MTESPSAIRSMKFSQKSALMNSRGITQLTRRAALRNGALLLGGAALKWDALSSFCVAQSADNPKPEVTMGLITDIHYADKPPSRTRFYRESLAKITEAIDEFNRSKVDCLIELGDLIDSGETVEKEAKYLETIAAECARFHGPRHFVLGNHDAWSLTKPEFLKRCSTKKEFYSFDQGKFHVVILDGCYRADGVPYGEKNFKWTDSDIPIAQRDWLAADLKATDKAVIVFVHQRLDVKNVYAVKSAPAVREILEDSKKVRAVFQGHSHKNDYHEINGIHYCTLRAIIEGSGAENSGYSNLEIFADGSIKVNGFRSQVNYAWHA